jgi:uncharacterized metal-binding protein
MPSGQTHDRITLWSLPIVTGLAGVITQSGNLTLMISGGFLFSGLMLSPDLDLQSRPYQRWGWLRWIWIPYQKVVRHRSIVSHGFVIGTTLRVLYLASWIVGLGVLSLAVIQFLRDEPSQSREMAQAVGRSLFEYRVEGIALLVGLELGAISHIVSDWVSSTYKRFKKKPKRKSSRRKPPASKRNK